MMKTLNKVKDADGKNIDLTAKLFNEIAPKYEGELEDIHVFLNLDKGEETQQKSLYYN